MKGHSNIFYLGLVQWAQVGNLMKIDNPFKEKSKCQTSAMGRVGGWPGGWPGG